LCMVHVSPSTSLSPGPLSALDYATGRQRPRGRFREFLNKVPTLAARSGGGVDGSHSRRCSGLDVHKETVVACVRLALDGKITRQGRAFEPTTSGLLLPLAW
jgi:hypothetical protein